MTMDGREAALRRWFGAWLDRDASAIDAVFAQNIAYSECYGPEYRGVGQIRRWFDDWNRKGRVLEWTIREVYGDGDTLVAVWYFRCDYEENTDGFNGVTVATFDAEGRIVRLREFQSKAEHVFPYAQEEANG